MCLFDALIGNHDRHGRNFGFIESPRGKTLAPIYDNPSYVAIEEFFLESDLNPCGKIATESTNNPTMKDYVSEFHRLGFRAIVARFQKRVKLDAILSIIKQAFISDKRKKALKKLVAKRYQELIDA